MAVHVMVHMRGVSVHLGPRGAIHVTAVRDADNRFPGYFLVVVVMVSDGETGLCVFVNVYVHIHIL
jgi:hypothetical protein